MKRLQQRETSFFTQVIFDFDWSHFALVATLILFYDNICAALIAFMSTWPKSVNVDDASVIIDSSVFSKDSSAFGVPSIGISLLRFIMYLLLGMFLMDIWTSVCVYNKVNHRVGNGGGRTLIPDVIDFRHALSFIKQKMNFKIQVILGILHVLKIHTWSSEPSNNDVVHYLINTGMSIFAKYETKEEGVMGIFRMTDFAYPMIENRHDVSIEVSFFIPAACKNTIEVSSKYSGIVNTLEGCQVESFVFDGETISDNRERLIILSMIIGAVVHPMEHSFFQQMYAHRNDEAMRDYPEMFHHGQYLNEIANEFTADTLAVDRVWMGKVLELNSKTVIPPHHISLYRIKPYSRFVRFLLPARAALQKQKKIHGIKIDLEVMFITTIVHATDHLFIGEGIKSFNLHSKKWKSSWFNFMTIIAYLPSQKMFTNLLKDKQKNQPFYTDLYNGLAKIDKFLANNVTLSISY